MTQWIAIQRVQRSNYDAFVDLDATLTVTPDTDQQAEANIVASHDVSLDSDYTTEIPNAATAVAVTPEIDLDAEVALEATLTVRTPTHAGFPYTFPFTFTDGTLAPEATTEFPAEIDIENNLDEALMIEYPTDITLIDSFDIHSDDAGFPYKFPFKFKAPSGAGFPYTFPFTLK